MRHERAKSPKRSHALRDLWRLVLALVTAIAVIQELRKPVEDRTWHGKVADLVPYDFRRPTKGRIRETYWNPDGPILPSKVWGVGWALNFGAVKKLLSN